MNQKFSLWTITIIDQNGFHTMIECESQLEVLGELKTLQVSGQDMDYVNVYPPKSSLTLTELIEYAEE